MLDTTTVRSFGVNLSASAAQLLITDAGATTRNGRRLWGAHDVRTHGAGTKRFTHPVVGELTLAYEELAVTAEPGLVMLVYSAEPGSPSADRLKLLGSWATPSPDLAATDTTGKP